MDVQLSGGEEEEPRSVTPSHNNAATPAEGAAPTASAAAPEVSAAVPPGVELGEETYDLITDEEVQRSMTESMMEPGLHDPK